MEETFNIEERFDKIKGTLMGCFIGDAIGAAYEFPKSTIIHDKDAINNGLLSGYSRSTYYTKINRLPPVEFEAGTITDDSILTIELLSSLSLKETKKQRLRRYYDTIKKGGEFGSESCGQFGKNTIALFKNLKYEENYISNFKANPGEYATTEYKPESNGCLMRCSPLSFRMNIPDSDNEIEEEVMLTNPSENCVNIIKIYLALCIYGQSGTNAKEAFENIREVSKEIFEDHKELEIIFNCIVNKEIYEPINDPKKKGWINVAFYYSLISLAKYIEGDEFHQIIPWIVKQGGDTDTNAAISGALLGSFIGYNNLKKNDMTYRNIRMILKDNELKDVKMKYRRVPKRVWKIICERAKKLMMS